MMLIYEIRIGYCAVKNQNGNLEKQIYHTEYIESKLLSVVRTRATNKLKDLEEMQRFHGQHLRWEKWSEPKEYKKNCWMTQKKSDPIDFPTIEDPSPAIQGIVQITWETRQMTFDDISNYFREGGEHREAV